VPANWPKGGGTFPAEAPRRIGQGVETLLWDAVSVPETTPTPILPTRDGTAQAIAERQSTRAIDNQFDLTCIKLDNRTC